MSDGKQMWGSSGHAANHLRTSLATLRGVRGMVELFELDEQYAGHYQQGFGMAVSQMIAVLDALIAKEEAK